NPGADPESIAFAVDGGIFEIDANGDLVMGSGEDGIRFLRPLIYQQTDGRRHEISGGYVLKHNGNVGFFVREYDANQPLIIDPVFIYSSYLGGNGDENRASGSELKRADIAADADGNTYLTGNTDLIDFPTANPLQSAAAGLGCPRTVFDPTAPPV